VFLLSGLPRFIFIKIFLLQLSVEIDGMWGPTLLRTLLITLIVGYNHGWCVSYTTTPALRGAARNTAKEDPVKKGPEESSQTVAPFVGSVFVDDGAENFLIQLNQLPPEAKIGVVSVSGLGNGSFRIREEKVRGEASWFLDDGEGHRCASGIWASEDLVFDISSIKHEDEERKCKLSGNEVLTRIIQIVQVFNQLGDKRDGIPDWVSALLDASEAGSKPIPKVTLTDSSVLQIDSDKVIFTWRLYRLFEERKLPWYAGFGFVFSGSSVAHQALLRRLVTASSILSHVPSESSSSPLPLWALAEPEYAGTGRSEEEVTRYRAACEVWFEWAKRVIRTECAGCEEKKQLFVEEMIYLTSTFSPEEAAYAENRVRRLVASNAPILTLEACNALAFLTTHWDAMLRSTTLTLEHLGEFHEAAGTKVDVERTEVFLETVLYRRD
jgi:hypothetical protein